MVTLTGTAGTGKTRLAIEVGSQIDRDKGAEVWFVDLAPVRDARLVDRAVLAVLGYRIVNYWLPLIPGAVAYLRLRLRPDADGKGKGKGKPAAPQAG